MTQDINKQHIKQLEQLFPELEGLIHEEEMAGVLEEFDLCVSMKDLLPILLGYRIRTQIKEY